MYDKSEITVEEFVGRSPFKNNHLILKNRYPAEVW
jgi:hypothetical protein